jgi:hypothetical protein
VYRFFYRVLGVSKQRLREQQKKYDEWKRQKELKENNRVDTEQPIRASTHTESRPDRTDTGRLSANPEWEKQREENRRKHPELAKFVDEIRKHFPGAEVISITPRSDLAPTTHELDEQDAQDDPR